jgi:predicted nuclease with TOPRIM domain
MSRFTDWVARIIIRLAERGAARDLMRLAADANAIAAELEDANREIERLRGEGDELEGSIEGLLETIKVYKTRIEELERER